MLGRLLILGGAGALGLSALLPWVEIEGSLAALDLGIIGADVAPQDRTVLGVDTGLWPVLAAGAGVVVLLGLLGIARRLVVAIGLLALLAGAALLYYLANVVEIEAGERGGIEGALAEQVLTSSIGPGVPLLLGGAGAIVGGALLAGRR